MIIDTEDPLLQEQLNPLERQVLRGLSDRLAMQAWQRAGWGHPDQGEDAADTQPRRRGPD